MGLVRVIGRLPGWEAEVELELVVVLEQEEGG